MIYRDPPTIPLDQLHWTDTSEEEGAGTRLLAQIRIGNLPMHLEAREVTQDEAGFQTTIDYPEDYDAMAGVADTAFQTLMIGDREYFLFALPHGD